MTNTPIWRIVMLFWCALWALWFSSWQTSTGMFSAYLMIAFAIYWLFRVWEDLRQRRQA